MSVVYEHTMNQMHALPKNLYAVVEKKPMDGGRIKSFIVTHTVKAKALQHAKSMKRMFPDFEVKVYEAPLDWEPLELND